VAQVEVGSDDLADDPVGTYGPGAHLIGDGTDDSDDADDNMDFVIKGNAPGDAWVSVDVDITSGGDDGGDMTYGAPLPLANVRASGDGGFQFPKIGTDDIPDEGSETVTFTVSTSGQSDSVIVLNFDGGSSS
jgi:hypothetical protein